MRRLILAATAFLSGVAGGCFLKPASAPGFRYTCESDADCLARDCKGGLIPMADAEGLVEGCDTPEVKADGTLGVGYRQTCIAGLCEFACDLYTFADDCPPASGYSFCFNGRCANICGTDDLTKYNFDSTDDFCTPPQRCIPFAEDQLDPEVLKEKFGVGGGGPGGFSIDGLTVGAGFCGTRCDADGAPDCPPGQYCTGALCVPGCDDPSATACEDGKVCFAYGGLSACLIPCDESADSPCPESLICVPGVNICQPSCLATESSEGVNCEQGFECDPDLGVCIPESFGGSSGGGSEESSG